MHITWVHIHPMFVVDLLHTSIAYSKKKTSFEQRGILHQDYLPFGPKNCHDTWPWPQLQTILNDSRFLLVTSKDITHLS